MGKALWLGEDRGAKGLVQGQLAEGRGGADLELSRAPVHMTLRVRCTAGAGEVPPDGGRGERTLTRSLKIMAYSAL